MMLDSGVGLLFGGGGLLPAASSFIEAFVVWKGMTEVLLDLL